MALLRFHHLAGEWHDGELQNQFNPALANNNDVDDAINNGPVDDSFIGRFVHFLRAVRSDGMGVLHGAVAALEVVVVTAMGMYYNLRSEAEITEVNFGKKHVRQVGAIDVRP